MTTDVSPRETGRLLRLAVPVIFTSVGNMMMGLVDTMVVGQYSSLALAGVAAGNSVFYTVAMIGIGFLGAMDPIVAQSHGAREPKQALQCLASALQQALVFALLATPLLLFIAAHLDWTGAAPDVAHAAEPFLRTLSYGLLPMMIFQVFQRYWQGMEIALPFTLIMILSNIINYIFALAFVHGRWGFPPMGAEGAAWATLVVRLVSLVAAVIYTLWLWKKRPYYRPDFARLLPLLKNFHRSMHVRIFRLGLPSSLQMGLEVCAFSLTTLMVARLGAEMLATHQIVLNIASFAFMFPLGLSAATATRVGYHMGRKHRPEALTTSWLGIVIGALMMATSALILFAIPNQLLRLFTQDLAVIQLGVSLIFLCSLFQIFDGIQVVSAGALRGLGDTKTALYTNLLAHWCLGLPVGFTLCFWLNKGLWGLWVGLALGLFFTAVFNTYAILRKRLT
ncbi:MAG TPA: MATE family efflux transporter [Oligoflexus sp.]|uniref:MATE family efflux transporter n=1 Tax=Oligoflexus sp. TaxID=1971216 RepID=UPI002D7E7B35|nr:MATE family efflux transporter [Oligoflexus sp.]HET9238283.1 MATE family efflux transporter [Oligoflexus sp.]